MQHKPCAINVISAAQRTIAKVQYRVNPHRADEQSLFAIWPILVAKLTAGTKGAQILCFMKSAKNNTSQKTH